MTTSLFFDGGLRQNKMTYGWIVLNENIPVASGYGYYTNKNTTVNMAEYHALSAGLEYLVQNNIKDINIYGDSQVVCYQLTGLSGTKSKNLKEKQKEIKEMLSIIERYKIIWVPRKNNIADRLTRF